MALLSLKDIGKIYVNEGNVTTGIRGVNLEFNKGEFVAVTGESGSGKSTLLNVISGMDTYEEGEMFIEGEPTSHYLQTNFEEYRNKYISFVFQDYNIIESFTVLENVELALMNIEDKKQRRTRALELIDRVGLRPWIHHKGSKLSGGQKQRTVIARALAKDSPIILADEPTGNLDAATSKEIIDLLYEVSKDKLLIIVTHNYEEVKEYATRHVRIFDGKVYYDKTIKYTDSSDKIVKQENTKKQSKWVTNLKNGITLGSSIFKSTPILTTFTIFLLILGSLSMLLVTSFCITPLYDLQESQKMFKYHNGRVVFMRRDAAPLLKGEVSEIANEYKAVDFISFDLILEEQLVNYYDLIYDTVTFDYEYYGKEYEPEIGRAPEKYNEVMLYLPLYLKTYYGTDEIEENTIEICGVEFEITGISYFYDNRQNAKIISNKEGFEFLSCLNALKMNNASAEVIYNFEDGSVEYLSSNMEVDMTLEGEKVVVPSSNDWNIENVSLTLSFYIKQSNYNGMLGGYYESNKKTVTVPQDILEISTDTSLSKVIISRDYYYKLTNEYCKNTYTQGSLFYKNDKEAAKAIEKLNSTGYIAVLSSTEFEPDIYTVIENTFAFGFMAILWILAVLFLGFFISLCLSRTIGSIKSDLAIMRSMGITVKVIKIGVYTKMIMSLIVSFIPVILVAILVFVTPKINATFTYLTVGQYLLVFLGVALIDLRVTKKQIKKLFGISVKKSIKGGADQ